MTLFEIISESTNSIALAAAICLVIYVYLRWSQMPPGPTGLPYLGYYPFLSDENCTEELIEMKKKYGKIFCLKATGQLYAHISDLKTIREVSVTKSDCFAKRPANFTLFQDIFGGGVFFLNGEEWKALRKFFLLKFKELGMGKKAQEGIVQDSLRKIVSSLNKCNGNTSGVVDLFSGIANDVVRHMIFGNVKLDEKDVQKFNEAYFTTTEFSNGLKLLLSGPILKYILLPFVPKYRNYRKYKKQVDTFMQKFVQQHEKEFDRNNIRNLVDCYINERKMLEDKNNPNAKFFTERGLVSSIIQFFGDGTLGVSMLTVAILTTLSSYPDVQKRIQSEIDEVIGRNRLPSLDDKSKLSYTNATIYEGLRTTKFFPLLPTVECTKETTLEGCRIPKGTIALFNTWAAFHDAETYPEPYRFDPTRFLSVDGKKTKCEIPVVFGVGKRSCAGESLVNMQLLLYIATVLQHFDLHPVKAQEKQFLGFDSFKATPRAS